MTKLVILDRDGVINLDSLEYIKSPDEWVALPGSIDAIAKLSQNGYLIAVATNQSGISRGYYDEETLSKIHEKLLNAVHAKGGEIACIEYCSDMPNSGSEFRKPAPGMLKAILKKLNCAPADAIMIGDRMTDILAAKAAGVRPQVILSGMTNRKQLEQFEDIPVFNSLKSCVESLLSSVGEAVEPA